MSALDAVRDPRGAVLHRRVMRGAVPSGLTAEGLGRYLHQGVRDVLEPPRPMTPLQTRIEEALQTELYWDPRWEDLYNVWPGKPTGCGVPKGLVIGAWEIVQRDGGGDVVCRWRSGKIITTAGKNALAAYLAVAAPTGAFMKFLSTGTGAAAAAVGDTALGGGTGNPITEIGSSSAVNRLTGTGSSASNVYQQTGTTPAGRYSGQTIAEAGMHDSVTVQSVAGTPSGVMYDRSLLSPTAVMGTLDTLALTFQITFS